MPGNVLRSIYGLFAWLTFVLVTIPAIALLVVVPGEQKRRRVVRGAARLLLALTRARPHVSGLEQLPHGRVIVAANHASYLDGVVLAAVLPPDFTFVIKKEMARVPLAGFLLRSIGSAFVARYNSRHAASGMRRILREARRDRSLVFFPEGTFTGQPGLRAFHSGAFAAAARSNATIVPIVIRGTREAFPAGRWLPQPARIEVIVKPPVAQAGAPNPDQLMRACRRSILEDLGEPDLAG